MGFLCCVIGCSCVTHSVARSTTKGSVLGVSVRTINDVSTVSVLLCVYLHGSRVGLFQSYSTSNKSSTSLFLFASHQLHKHYCTV